MLTVNEQINFNFNQPQEEPEPEETIQGVLSPHDIEISNLEVQGLVQEDVDFSKYDTDIYTDENAYDPAYDGDPSNSLLSQSAPQSETDWTADTLQQQEEFASILFNIFILVDFSRFNLILAR